MTQDAAGASPERTLLAKIGWGALIFATLYVCYFRNLGAIGFVGPDEPRYAWIARAMAETGDWVTPRLYGKPWFEKPPLYYWGAALSFKLFGVSEAAARLPSAICALLATLAMAWLAWRVYGAETARWLLLLLPTTVGMIGFSHAAATDMPFSGMLTVAMVFAAVVLGLTRSAKSPPAVRMPWAALILFGFFLGLAMLAKGPAAIILSGGAVFFWAVFTKRWKDAFRLLHPAAIASFCVTALPWYILCARRNPDFFHVFIIEHNFKRFLTPEFQHIQPFWYYGPIVLIAVFPWIAILISEVFSAATAAKTARGRDALALLLACWVLFCIAFFSVSRSKLPGYVLPIMPAVGLLMTIHVVTSWSSRLKARWLGIGTSVVLVSFGILVNRFGSKIPVVTDIRPAALVSDLIFLPVGGGIICGLLSLWKPGRKPLFAATATLLAIMSVGSRDLWELDAGVSARPAADRVRELWPAEGLTNAKVYKLRRDYTYALNFYAHREIPEWSPADGSDVLIFSAYKNVEELKKLGVPCFHYEAFPAVFVCGDTGLPRRAPTE